MPNNFIVETIGWISTLLFLLSIIIPQRVHLHTLGIFASLTTGYYAFAHGATAIWVKWAIAFFFHAGMCYKLSRLSGKSEKKDYRQATAVS